MAAAILKKCSCCGIEKPLDDFHNSKNRKHGKHAYCKLCVLQKNRTWVENNRERHAQTCANWYAKNKAAAKQRGTEWHYQSRYGVSHAEFLAMCAAVGCKCPLCQREMRTDGVKASNSAVLDHCHDSGKIRGVLCSACNTAIGLMRDDADTLLRAIKYLKG